MHLARAFDVRVVAHEPSQYVSLRPQGGLGTKGRAGILKGSQLYYQIRTSFWLNRELVDMLAAATGRKSRLMGRGVDTDLFSPARRTAVDGVFRLGFVGRLRAEKDVRILPMLADKLVQAGKTNFEFLIVGEGSERQHLEEGIRNARFPGFLSGAVTISAR
jgi:glycosyltransferase involved in cell wall biosynthesis